MSQSSSQEPPCICRCPAADHMLAGEGPGFRACHCCRCFAYRPTLDICHWYAAKAEQGDYRSTWPWQLTHVQECPW